MNKLTTPRVGAVDQKTNGSHLIESNGGASNVRTVRYIRPGGHPGLFGPGEKISPSILRNCKIGQDSLVKVRPSKTKSLWLQSIPSRSLKAHKCANLTALAT